MQDCYDFSTAGRGKFYHPEAELVLPNELMPPGEQQSLPIGETQRPTFKKRLTLTPAPEGSGYSDIALNHDQAFLDTHCREDS